MRPYTKTFNGTGLDPLNGGGGTYIRLMTPGAAVTVLVFKNNSQIAEIDGITAGFGWESRDVNGELQPFDNFTVTSATAQTITVYAGFGDFKIDGVISGTVQIQSGTTVVNSTVAVTNAAGGVAAVAAATARKAVRFLNGDAAATIYLGPAGVDNTSAIALAPGQMWNETEGANAAWYAIASVAGPVNLRVQTVT